MIFADNGLSQLERKLIASTLASAQRQINLCRDLLNGPRTTVPLDQVPAEIRGYEFKLRMSCAAQRPFAKGVSTLCNDHVLENETSDLAGGCVASAPPENWKDILQ